MVVTGAAVVVGEEVDLSVPRRVHVVGVGGAGMSAIAEILRTLGHRVTGSDLKDGPALDRLRAAEVAVAVGHDAANVGDAEFVAISTAIPAGNPEVVAARGAGIPVVRRADVLAALCRLRRTVAVAGTHGKTTTSSMLALVLVDAGRHPSFLIGGEINEVGTGAAWDEGPDFVVEADESDGTFLHLGPVASVVTNVEADHLDHYGNYEALVDAFTRFVRTTDGPAVVGIDGPDGARVADAARAAGARVVTFGTNPTADVRIVDATTDADGARGTLQRDGADPLRIVLAVAGLHNLANATAAAVTALELGVEPTVVQRSLARFAGVARRLQHRGFHAGITFVDDYAHLPSEAAAAVGAMRASGWGRVVAVFQPHRYSRIAELGEAFGDSFVEADLTVVTDVYAAGERPRPGVTGMRVVHGILDRHPYQQVVYLPRRSDLVAYLAATLRPGDCCLSMGAGDVTSLPDEVQAAVRARQ
ncbi:MAG: UDP-N-acetylmuramate--L-alanine ligase [Actinobacteria bacterium]|nr:UDP-N-acetylmuramate--L-alanine ligase [Actinomycetota bacterium]